MVSPQDEDRTGRWLTKCVLFIIILFLLPLIQYLPFFPSSLSSPGSGPGGQGYPEPDSDRGTVSFQQMLADYRRPDGAAILDQLQTIAGKVDQYDSPSSLLQDLKRAERQISGFQSQFTLVSIWYSIDSSDQKAREEYRYFAEQIPVLTSGLHELYAACAASPHVGSLELTGYGRGFFSSYADEADSHSRLTLLTALEAQLEAEYEELTTGQTVPYQGRDVLWSELAADPNVTGAAYEEAVQSYYDTYSQPLAEIMVQLISARRELAALSGYDTYEEYAFDYYYRDYTPEQARHYVDDVRRLLAPLSKAAEDLWDDPATSQPLTESLLRRAVSSALDALDSDPIHEAWDFMERYELCDLASSPYKTAGGYEQYISMYEAPFIVLNTDGVMADIQSLAHEFGHFYDDYVNRGSTWNFELAEVESQAMERLVLYQNRELSPSDINRQLWDLLLLDGLDTLVWQSLYHDFESRMYQLSDEQLTPDGLCELFHQVCTEYGVDDSSRPYYSYYSWIDISHLFTSPFYIISYPLSCDAAMQLGELEDERPGQGLAVYENLVKLAPSGGFEETLEQAGLVSPLAEGRVEQLARQLAEQLDLEYALAA